MYRKHLREMESKSGIKTIDRLVEFPVVNTAISKANDYYGKVKEKNMLTRVSCNLAELSFKAMLLAATPVATICKKPIGSVDSYLDNKLEELEHSYPGLKKPTEVLTADIKEVYDKNLKAPLEQTTEGLKNFGVNKVQSVVKAGTDTIDSARAYGLGKLQQTGNFGYRVIDSCLENRLAKLVTDPILNVTEKSLDYLIPESKADSDETEASSSDRSVSKQDVKTLNRINEMNHRVYKHLYQTTLNQLSKLHTGFAYNIQRLKHVSDIISLASKQKLGEASQSITNNTLFAQCAKLVQTNRIPFSELEAMAKNYYKIIMTDLTQMIGKYIKLLQNFPVIFNATLLRKISQGLSAKINMKGPVVVYLNSTIEQLLLVHGALVTYTNQVLKALGNSRLVNQILKSMPDPTTSRQTLLTMSPLPTDRNENENENQQRFFHFLTGRSRANINNQRMHQNSTTSDICDTTASLDSSFCFSSPDTNHMNHSNMDEEGTAGVESETSEEEYLSSTESSSDSSIQPPASTNKDVATDSESTETNHDHTLLAGTNGDASTDDDSNSE